MPPREDVILFLDLETTGVDESKDEIIEIGLSLVETTEGFPEKAALSIVVQPGGLAFSRMMANKVVREMHEANGLLDVIGAGSAWRDIATVDDTAVRWLDVVAGNDGSEGREPTHIPLGGSGVLHFDRKFIRKYMPKLDKRLTYWAHDVGVLRRSFIQAGAPYASMEGKTHRALDDARVHADEFRWYQTFIKGEE
jgi:oligoribonuclease